MFDDNWVLYLFIIMVLFGRDGEIAGTELIVLFASTLAVLIGEKRERLRLICWKYSKFFNLTIFINRLTPPFVYFYNR
ncbi:MAG: hypothetical protein L6V85_02110 [Clostridiales bacterium]|nr:MAG: hypothetical protein L6V85_02110 [Clostridiales bacterium]